MRASGIGRGGSDRYVAETDTSGKTIGRCDSGNSRGERQPAGGISGNSARLRQLCVVSAGLSDGPISDKHSLKTADLTHKSAKVGRTFAWGSHRVSSESSPPLSDSALSGRRVRPHDFQSAR